MCPPKYSFVTSAAGLLLACCAFAQSPNDVAGSAAEPQLGTELVRLDAVHLDAITVEGSSVLSAQEIAAFTAPYENRDVSFEALQELTHALSQEYLQRGYVTSGVVLADQQVVDGRVTLQAIEGGRAEITIAGNRRLRDRAIARRVEPFVQAPLRINHVQAGLEALQNEPLVERVSAELQPGTQLGDSRLRISITERRPLELMVLAANDRAASLGEDRGTLGVTYRGLVGNGDVLSGRFGFSEGAEDNSLSYRVPLTVRGTTLDVNVTEQDADIIEEPFDDIDITSRLETWSVTATRPFGATANGSLLGFVSFEHKRSASTLLGMPFSFSAGDVNGAARGSAVGTGVEWSRRWGPRTLVVRGSAVFGVDAFDATINPAAPDSKFQLYVGQLQYVRGTGWRAGQLIARAALQAADQPLLAMYKMPIGGAYSVRGYRESELVRDNGFVASLEYRFAAFIDASGQRRGKLDFAVFTDYGLSVDEEPLPFAERREHLSSVGIGVLWDPLPGLHMQIYRGADLTGRDQGSESLQDRGIHYSLVFRRAF